MFTSITGALNTRTMAIALVALCVMASLTLGGGPSTSAAFTAQTTSAGNEFSQGTLVLQTTANGGTSCYSLAGGVAGGSPDSNDFAGCPALFVGPRIRMPGDVQSALVTVRNGGSLPATSFRIFSPAPCADADDPAEAFHGTGSPCGKAALTIQQCSAASCAPGTETACWYGSTASGRRGVDEVCAAPSSTAAASATLAEFSNTHASASTGIKVDGGLAAGAEAYFKVTLALPKGAAGADNALMGRKASFGVSWYVEQ